MTTNLQEDWQLLEPQNLAVITTRQVISENYPILYVLRDSDGEWQFHTGEDVNEEDAKVIGLSEIVKRDSSISALADLPLA